MHLVATTGVTVAEADRDAAFAGYVAARQSALLRTAYLLCGDWALAEDLVQTALAKLYLAWGRVRSRGEPDAYVRRILVNESRSWWRRARRRPEEVTADVPDQGREETYDDGVAAAVWELVRSLPPRQRAVVVLRYYEDLTEAEIAQTLGISTGTVKSQASRALANLRDRLPTGLREETP